jgi:hypothetical protein
MSSSPVVRQPMRRIVRREREEFAMDRKMVDCRKIPSENNCTVAIAGTEQEVLEAAVAHAVASHGHEDTPELREMIRSGLEDAEPALA